MYHGFRLNPSSICCLMPFRKFWNLNEPLFNEHSNLMNIFIGIWCQKILSAKRFKYKQITVNYYYISFFFITHTVNFMQNRCDGLNEMMYNHWYPHSKFKFWIIVSNFKFERLMMNKCAVLNIWFTIRKRMLCHGKHAMLQLNFPRRSVMVTQMEFKRFRFN